MSNLLTVVRYLVPVFATIGLLCVASWAAVATLVYRETRNTRHDAEDAAVFGPREVYGPAVDWTFGGRVDPDETPIHSATAAHIAKHEAARTDLDAEWWQVMDETGGAA